MLDEVRQTTAGIQAGESIPGWRDHQWYKQIENRRCREYRAATKRLANTSLRTLNVEGAAHRVSGDWQETRLSPWCSRCWSGHKPISGLAH